MKRLIGSALFACLLLGCHPTRYTLPTLPTLRIRMPNGRVVCFRRHRLKFENGDVIHTIVRVSCTR